MHAHQDLLRREVETIRACVAQCIAIEPAEGDLKGLAEVTSSLA